MNQESQLAKVLSALMFEKRPFVELADRYTTSDYHHRINGRTFTRNAWIQHAQTVVAEIRGGWVDVLEEIDTGQRCAGRYVFHLVGPDERIREAEAHIFAMYAWDGRAAQMVELSRLREETDDWKLLGEDG